MLVTKRIYKTEFKMNFCKNHLRVFRDYQLNYKKIHFKTLQHTGLLKGSICDHKANTMELC